MRPKAPRPGRHNPAMTHSSEKMHVYRREIDGAQRTSLSVLASHVNHGARVLDLGTGSGALGKFLQSQGTTEVDGVTYNAAEAEVAGAGYRRIVVADLDEGSWAQSFAGAQYDCIVCADVLEHLKRPQDVLAACRDLLAPGGRLLISIPNVAYSGLVAELLDGEFAYREEGLLDSTHLRFFTHRSLLRFLAQHGWATAQIERIERPLHESEFKMAFDSLPPAVARHLLATPEALTYQFIVVAHPGPAAGATTRDDVPEGPAQALFSAQLFLRRQDGFDEERKLTRAAAIGEPRQNLSFTLQDDGAPVTGLRLDPADRPGYLYLYRMALLANDGSPLWQWQADAAGFGRLQGTPRHDLLLQPPWHGGDAAPMLLHGDDPWLELPIPADVFADQQRLAGARFEVELGWPMSADYLALAQVVAPLQARMQAEEQAAAARQHHLQEALERERRETAEALERERREAAQALDNVRKEAEDALSANSQVISQRNDELDRARKQNRQLEAHRNTLRAEQQAAIEEGARLRQERDRLARHLEEIHNSTVIRVTRPLVRAKVWLDHKTGRQAVQPTPAAAGALQPPPHPVDVIVPVYRGLDDTRRCIESALASVCTTPMRLVVLNDASPEPEVTEWLRAMAARESRVLLLENLENLGFVGTVNRGMSQSRSNDVVLLNSDAEVANDWLDRLRAAAYSDQRVSTVTPFSNNATICSYPRFCEANPLPPGYDTQRLDALFRSLNAGAAVDVPTGVGFCMYIRRDSLDAVGLFDEESFGKGYGEENDFCRRAAKLGWRNLHALDTFVLHAGGVSFGASKSARELAAMETLKRLHPDYEEAVHRFLAQDPARSYRQMVDLARLRASERPVVLAVTHALGGGTRRHVLELAAHLHAQAAFLLLTPDPNGGVELRWADPREALQLGFAAADGHAALLQLLQAVGVRLVHFHHLLGHSPATLALPEQLGVPYDFTAHDYHLWCPQISLTTERDVYCGEQGVAQCRACLARRPAPGGVDIEQWRSTHGAFLQEARHVLAPSLDAAQRLVRFVPTADIRYAPHTDIADAHALPVPTPEPLRTSSALKVVVIGALSKIKGADLLEAVALEAAQAEAPVEFHLLGFAYRTLRTQPKSCLTVHGQYDEEELPVLLARMKPDLVWFPAQWPETYSYTLSACLERGLPIVAPDLGAFPERLAHRPWTWLQPWDSAPSAWLDFFLAIRSAHFVAGVAPSPAPAPAAGVPVRPWSYAQDYLRDLPQCAAAVLPAREVVMAHLLDSTQTMTTTLEPPAPRNPVLRLYQHGGAGSLRRIVRLFPYQWRNRVRDWLAS